MFTALIVFGILICIIEVALWVMFRLKHGGLSFPREYDESFFRFLTLKRLTIIAIMHTVFLLAVLIFCILLLW